MTIKDVLLIALRVALLILRSNPGHTLTRATRIILLTYSLFGYSKHLTSRYPTTASETGIKMNAPDHNNTTESEEPQSKTSFRSSGNRVGVGVAIGTAIGAAYGASSGHMGQSLAMGVALGAALGAAFSFNPRGSS
ncbi:MAG TPA: hypothetical protein DEF45_20375 [Rhodopirellula sp.]|nr:hypothetical protein [Rhodopirellula sp.]